MTLLLVLALLTLVAVALTARGVHTDDRGFRSPPASHRIDLDAVAPRHRLDGGR
ncbi:hypothetical protein KUV85_03690 [Nocardioides panacisoli]|uniref:hypothetical protein n=1 Tax=Nocardioides panacisoli TaxID=627624 RepID=UPI001C62840B|nr:hypothetical protein [Nocardioides panacisoli]QYJ04796.1 hypothetical protein KUV85_03690 [Nocardioides panacisoli]